MISKFGVTINCLCPGPVKTDILRNATFKVKIITACIAPFFKNAKQGAQTTIHLAVADEVADITGEYFTDCKITKTSPMAMDVGLAKKLWDISETLVNLKPEERNY
ncbi:short-chain dehydrogenase TIC 32 A, chloroplastic-like [Daphnia pulex]|uniref:short-chain dehydrogenase TIC 32 A, chloroplastic-like n=1 Tax=Daphnia pulex TaxID=6669 RepID=UPI001EDCAF2C|nr:short-chain dehydrogenase TIC 32 A, chloroplastic-like [Daphnia pulex]